MGGSAAPPSSASAGPRKVFGKSHFRRHRVKRRVDVLNVSPLLTASMAVTEIVVPVEGAQSLLLERKAGWRRPTC
ncbi:hypothetical protein MRX96_039393 [Rhipicephalus microplus]